MPEISSTEQPHPARVLTCWAISPQSGIADSRRSSASALLVSAVARKIFRSVPGIVRLSTQHIDLPHHAARSANVCSVAHRLRSQSIDGSAKCTFEAGLTGQTRFNGLREVKCSFRRLTTNE